MFDTVGTWRIATHAMSDTVTATASGRNIGEFGAGLQKLHRNRSCIGRDALFGDEFADQKLLHGWVAGREHHLLTKRQLFGLVRIG